VDKLLCSTKLMSSAGSSSAPGHVRPPLAAKNTSASNYLYPVDGVFPPPSNDFQSGDAIVSIGNNTANPTPGLRQDHRLFWGTYIRPDSITVLHLRTDSSISGRVLVGLKDEALITLTASQFALHYGDWEHVTSHH